MHSESVNAICTELDPHSSTPVEILHVILLGFVKYFWRDVVHNQLKGNQAKKDILEQRLNSFDVSGLDIPPLAGHTLVQYAGSLTGRDFRAISQAAPFVLYDLVPPECFNAWVALSKMVPIIWQPGILDIKEYLVRVKHMAIDFHLNNCLFPWQTLLETEIDGFLLATAKWSPRWFNKPKFHILLHLPNHVLRFGPAILFATEAFESFNAVIRIKSIHSNRHAPSRDIARQFAQSSRVRHCLSGGRIPIRSDAAALLGDIDIQNVRVASAASISDPVVDAGEAGLWRKVGKSPLSVIAIDSIIQSYLGVSPPKKSQPGKA